MITGKCKGSSGMEKRPFNETRRFYGCEACGRLYVDINGAQLCPHEDTGSSSLRPPTPYPGTVAVPPMFSGWLRRTQQLQGAVYSTQPDTLEGDDFAWFTVFNTLAAIVELSELLANIPWKPWATRRGRPTEEGRQEALKELVDVLHFAANLGVALRVTDEELTTAYLKKMGQNAYRQFNGYQGQVEVGGG